MSIRDPRAPNLAHAIHGAGLLLDDRDTPVTARPQDEYLITPGLPFGKLVKAQVHSNCHACDADIDPGDAAIRVRSWGFYTRPHCLGCARDGDNTERERAELTGDLLADMEEWA